MSRKPLQARKILPPPPLRGRVGEGGSPVPGGTPPPSPTLPRKGGGGQKYHRHQRLWLIQRYCPYPPPFARGGKVGEQNRREHAARRTPGFHQPAARGL